MADPYAPRNVERPTFEKHAWSSKCHTEDSTFADFMETARENYREQRTDAFQKMSSKDERVNDRKKWRQDLRVCIAAIEKGVTRQPWREPTAVAERVCPKPTTGDD